MNLIRKKYSSAKSIFEKPLQSTIEFQIRNIGMAEPFK